MSGRLLIVGSGLLGASLGLAARAAEWRVYLRDSSPAALALACDVGAGQPWHEGADRPTLVVVAAPPDVTAGLVLAALREFPEATVTDVASVKAVVASRVARAGADTSRYVGSHPMAGSERSGAGAANADLFRGRAWVIAPGTDATPAAERAVRDLAVDVGAFPLTYTPAEHDDAVAAVSHVPQLVSSLLAARLRELPSQALALAGQGLRDCTRIAHSDPNLWVQIIAGNAGPIAGILRALGADLERTVAALERGEGDPLAPGLAGTVMGVLEAGNRGVARIPGKHGGAPRRYRELAVLVPDKPGELGRLFGELGEAGVNIEDLSLEHSPASPHGVAYIQVDPGVAASARGELTRRGWSVLPARS